MKFKKGDVVERSGIKYIVLNPKENHVINVEGNYTDTLINPFSGEKKLKEAPYTVVSEVRIDLDGYRDFRFYMVKKGRNVYITAGCRFFTSVKAAKAHWSKPLDINFEFRNPFRTENRKFKNEQSLKIIDRLAKRLEA